MPVATNPQAGHRVHGRSAATVRTDYRVRPHQRRDWAGIRSVSRAGLGRQPAGASADGLRGREPAAHPHHRDYGCHRNSGDLNPVRLTGASPGGWPENGGTSMLRQAA
jgi:hypothetical protein